MKLSITTTTETFRDRIQLTVASTPASTSARGRYRRTHFYNFYLTWRCGFVLPSSRLRTDSDVITLTDVKIKWDEHHKASKFPGQGQDWVSVAIPKAYLDLFDEQIPADFHFRRRFRYHLYEEYISDELHAICRIYINSRSKFKALIDQGTNVIDELDDADSTFLYEVLRRRWRPAKLTVRVGLKYRGPFLEEEEYQSGRVILGFDACELDIDPKD
ncbi:hypothetical protein OC846_005179 [Tilletia horrida]|uniref:Uncharacterized protein n=1 Tax=Tilletia horrida TaxID=155126 RepID=A0AAN6GLX8_9BASI|nr:hypothetical protein OC846_005179 [Tilletia horrida]KAK0550105.1 hypothetical protein OC845_002796 [Tilletia horrida]KAK0562457.1 hypothetical protein OC861_005298 [Tilletia horrida]